jgi:CBS domain-containing protein
MSVSEVMVRRDRIIAIRKDASAEEVQRILLEEGHSRMPVYEGDLDHLVGYVVARDVLAMVWEQGLVVLDDIVRPLFAVPMTTRINVVLREMQARRSQIAVVVDEHGGSAGIVTIEDLVEELIGDVLGEHEVPEEIVRRESDDTALVAGWVPIAVSARSNGAADRTSTRRWPPVLAPHSRCHGGRLQAPTALLEVVDGRRAARWRVHHHQRADDDRVWRRTVIPTGIRGASGTRSRNLDGAAPDREGRRGSTSRRSLHQARRSGGRPTIQDDARHDRPRALTRRNGLNSPC